MINEMNIHPGKRAAAEEAVEYLEDGMVVGVGTGSTVNYFIDALEPWRHRLQGAVSSSEASTGRLRTLGIEVVDLNRAGDLALYVDGADEVDPHRRLIKGGGGALTREKIVSAVAKRFVCIVDGSKFVDVLGRFPLPVEVIPMASAQVARALAELGGSPVVRKDCVTDNGNLILDVHGLQIVDPVDLESRINQIVGVVSSGLFARRPADVCLLGTAEGVRTLTAL